MSIIKEVERLQQAKQDFKTKLIEKGVEVSDDELISDYPPKLDLIKGGATITTKSGWQGTAVPVGEYVENVYINNNLSIEEVVSLLNNMTLTTDGDPNIICAGSSGSDYIQVMIMNGMYVIFNGDSTKIWFASGEGTKDMIGFEGWNPSLEMVVAINFNNDIAESNQGVDSASENQKLSSLFSITEFTQVSGEQITLEGDYDGSTLVLDELPKGEWNGSVVPNSGYIERVYFNTSLSVEEVISIIESANLTYEDDGEYFVIKTVNSHGLSIGVQENIFFIIDTITGENLIFANVDIGIGVGWVYPNDYIDVNSEVEIEFGTQNNLLSSLISTTPFTQSKANTINVKSLIEQKKIPLEIKVNVEEGVDTTDATATANEIRKGFTAYIASGKVEGTIEDYDGSFEGGSNGNTLKALLDFTKSCSYLFYQNTEITDVTDYIQFNDTENVENTESMFNSCSNLEVAPLINTSKSKTARAMFYNCKKLNTIPIYDFTECTKLESMFYGCTNLKTVSLKNTYNVTTMKELFRGCSSLEEIKDLNMNKVTTAEMMFYNCTALKTVSLVDTFKTTSGTSNTGLRYMFYQCTSLETLSGLNFINSFMIGQIFYKCVALKNLSITNIQANIEIGQGTSYGHLLTLESLLNTCQECINVSAARTLTVGSENITKLSTVYVKLTNEPEVDSTLPKLPMVQCESTDEGAMLVADYMALKNWSLA